MFDCTLYWWQFTCLIFWNVRLHPLLVKIYLFDILECSTAPSTGDDLPVWYSGMFNCTLYWWRFTCLIFWNVQLHPLLVTIYLFDILECSTAPSTGDDLPVWYSGMFNCTLYWWRFTCLIFWNVRLHPLLVTIYLPVWYSGMFDSVWRSCLWYLDWWNTLPWSNQFTCLIFWNVRLSMEILSLILGLVKHSSMK